MKYENFQVSTDAGDFLFATVEKVSWTGKRKTIHVFRPKHSAFFRDLESGEWLLRHGIEDMCLASQAKQVFLDNLKTIPDNSRT